MSGSNENLRILSKSGESLETAGQRQDKKFQGNTHTHTHTISNTISEKRVSGEVKDTPFIAIVTKCARATLICLI